ncbi:MAG: hypothetical protein N2234_03990, partial [Planctomycetota bacterium]|nr:hypothetical protein [Planctomycetota bacterium]
VQDGGLTLYGREEQPSLLVSRAVCRVLEPPSLGGDGVSFKGDIRGRIAGRWYRFAQKMKAVENDITVSYSFPTPLPDGMVVSYGFKIPERVVVEGLVLVTASGQKTVTEQFEEPVVSEMVLKGRGGEVVVRFEPPFAVSATKKDGYLNVRGAVFAKDLVENRFSVTFSPFSAMRKKGAIEQMQNVRFLFGQRKFAEVLAAIRNLREEPVLTGDEKSELERIEKAVKERTDEWVSVAQMMVSDIMSEPRIESLSALKNLCKEVEAAYPDGYVVEKVRKMYEEAVSFVEQRKEKERAARVEQLLARARQYKERNLFGFAVPFYSYIQKAYPDTLWAKEAASQLEILGKKRRE